MIARNLLLPILLILVCLPVQAETRLAARFYPQEYLQLNSRWLEPHIKHKQLRQNGKRINLMLAESGLTELRLDIPSSFHGKAVKIYLVMPLQTPGLMGFEGLQVKWQSYDGFINGSAKPGSRSLLYEGQVNQGVLAGRIRFNLYIDARFVSGNLEFRPQYIIEGNTP